MGKAAVIDANVCIAIVSNEDRTFEIADNKVNDYIFENYELFAPQVLVSETLYALCKKLHANLLSQEQYVLAVVSFQAFLEGFSFNFNLNDVSLIERATQLQAGYGCSRSADCLYIALAKELMNDYDTVELVTFDKELPKQAARHAPTVTVRLLEV